MKQAKTTPDSKEGLHTQGEWKVIPEPKNDRFYIVCGNDHIAGTWTYIREGQESKEEAKANAELIVQAVNERKALLEHLENCVELLKWCGSSLTDKGKATVKEANIFLNNAKNI